MVGPHGLDATVLDALSTMVCRPGGEKRAAGGQKLRWNDVVAHDLKKCKMASEWRRTGESEGVSCSAQ